MTARPNRPAHVSLEMIPMPEHEARRLMRASQIVEWRGWCQGQLEDRRGRVCAVRAYQLAALESEKQFGGYGLLAVSLVLDTDLTVAQWNDGNGRSLSEVVSAYRRTAHALMEVARGN